MERLQAYIKAARQYGHSDEQIRSNLASTGWHPSHIEAAFKRDRSARSGHGRRQKFTSRQIVGLIAAITFILATASYGAVYRLHNSHSVVPTQPSVTFYYDDGKTVLWRNDQPVLLTSNAIPTKAPYFAFLALAELEKKYGVDYWKQGAWQVTTSLNAGLQSTAEKLVADNYPNVQHVSEGKADEEATILQDVKTGQIKAYVGGVDFSDPDHGSINYAAIHLPPGTSIYPFNYANLIEKTTTTGAGTMVTDTVRPFTGYPCTKTNLSSPDSDCLQDYDYLQPGNLSVRYALGGQRNIPAMQAMYDAAPAGSATTAAVDQLTNFVRMMGASSGYACYANVSLTLFAQCGGNAALGSAAYLSLADEANALSTFANNGKVVPQTAIVSIKLNGKTKLAWKAPAGKQVIRPDTAYIINDIMSDPNASYLPGSCTPTDCTNAYKFQRYNGWHFAVDSGNTNNGFDALMASWSTKYAVVSWAGSHLRNVSLPAHEALIEPLTRGLMEAVHNATTPANWQQPRDMRILPAYVFAGHIHYGDVEPSPASDLYPSWYGN